MGQFRKDLGKMRVLLLVLSLACFTACCANVVMKEPPEALKGDNFSQTQANEIANDVGSTGKLDKLAARSDAALDNLVKRGILQLNIAGLNELASHKESEWGHYTGYLVKSLTPSMQDIGDHKPLIGWLADFYNILEDSLGVDKCKKLHLSDIKTFNYAIPVVFHPCDFPMDKVTGTRQDEYKRHFSEGDVYYGILPVVTYWGADIACDVATSGGGIAWACGTIAGASEFISAKFLAPHISDFIFNQCCGGKQNDSMGKFPYENESGRNYDLN